LKIGSNEENLDISENRRRGKNGPHVIEKNKKRSDVHSRKRRNKTGKRNRRNSGHENQQLNKPSEKKK
jgi:hypothetical protein